MEFPKPRLGGRVCVPNTDYTTGGIGEIIEINGDEIVVKEAPRSRFNWEELCRTQVTLVDRYGSGKVLPVRSRVA